MIVTIGRLREGVPSTLNAFCPANSPQGVSPHLWGFPDYKTNTLIPSDYENVVTFSRDLKSSAKPYNQDYRIISVYHVTIDDKCNRAFIVDTGSIRSSDGKSFYIQSPAILVYYLPPNCCVARNFDLIRRVEIPESVWKNPLGFDFITIDYQAKNSCDDLFIYMNNIFDNSIVVYDYDNNYFWAFNNQSSFNPIPNTQEPLDTRIINTRIRKVAVRDAIRGTVCDNAGVLPDEIVWQYMEY
ncbi:hypothetical protein DMENIID0001_030680 [Sergentomyia squamirostris]